VGGGVADPAAPFGTLGLVGRAVLPGRAWVGSGDPGAGALPDGTATHPVTVTARHSNPPARPARQRHKFCILRMRASVPCNA